MQFGTVLGFGLGSVWAFGGLDAFLLASLLTVLGALVTGVITGHIDLADYVGRDRDDPSHRTGRR
jgi:hypothetical protein